MNEKKQVRLAKAAIENLPLPAAGKRFERWWVSGVPGLCIRVMDSGVKSFLFVRRIGTRTTEITLGKYPSLLPDQAKRLVADMNAQAAHGVDPASAIRAQRAEMTLKDAFDQYLERHAKLHKRTWHEDERRWRLYLFKPLGNRKLSEISRREIASLHADIGQTGRQGHGSPYEANRVLALLSVIFSKLREWDLAEINPTVGIRKFREIKRDRFLKSNELPNFFKALGATQQDYARDFFLLLLLTGARKTNVLEMAWKDIDLQQGTWRIPVTKNGDPQNVALVPQAVDVLQQRLLSKSNSWVFPSPTSASGHMEEPKKAWRNIRALITCYRLIGILADPLKWTAEDIVLAENVAALQPHSALSQWVLEAEKLGLAIDIHRDRQGRLVGDDIRIHDLRRTLGSWQAMEGASLAIIGKSLNHKSPQATAIYARLDLDPVRASLMKATSAILHAAQGVNSGSVDHL